MLEFSPATQRFIDYTHLGSHRKKKVNRAMRRPSTRKKATYPSYNERVDTDFDFFFVSNMLVDAV